MLDCREARHAAEEVARRAFGEQVGGEVDEGPMNIVLRNCRGDAVDVRGRHMMLPLWLNCYDLLTYMILTDTAAICRLNVNLDAECAVEEKAEGDRKSPKLGLIGNGTRGYRRRMACMGKVSFRTRPGA